MRRFAWLIVLFALMIGTAYAADISDSTWSETDSSNNSTPPHGWPAGMNPSQVEPTARGMMGAIKRWYNRTGITVVSGGTANAQTLTYDVAPSAYVAGDQYTFQAGVTNTSATTINVNSLGAIAVVTSTGDALTGGEIVKDATVTVFYDGTSFRLQRSALMAPSPSKTIHLSSSGSGKYEACFNASTPCGNLTDAVAAASLLYSTQNNIVINCDDTGPFTGGTITASVHSRFTFDITGSTGRGPLIEILGPCTFQQPATSTVVITVNSGARVWLHDVTLVATASNFNVALAADWLSYAKIDGGSIIDSANFDTADAIAINAGHYSVIEIGDITLKNDWLYAIEGEVGAAFYSSNVITCDATFNTSYYWVLEGSHVHTVGSAGYSGCPNSGIIGIYALGNSSFRRVSGSYDVPADSYRINSPDFWSNGNNYRPTIGTCSNGSLSSGSDNYTGRITFTSNSPTCLITFGKPSTGVYWNSTPSCVASTNNETLFASAGTSTVSFSPQSASNFTSATVISYQCRPVQGG